MMRIVKRNVCDDKQSRLEHNLHTSVNGSVILPFREGLILSIRKQNVTTGADNMKKNTVNSEIFGRILFSRIAIKTYLRR